MREVRYTASEFELRGAAGEGATLTGYAAVFNSPTTIAGMFNEQVGSRAFTKTMKENDVRALFNHDPMYVLGRNRAGTLRLSGDTHGLKYEVDLPDTQQARDLWTLIDRGDVSQSSFAFETVKERVEQPKAEDELPMRTLQEVRLYDVSPVTYPAYEDTEVNARAALVVQAWSHMADEPAEDREAVTTEEPEAEPLAALDATPQPEPPTGSPIYVARLHLAQLPEL